MLVGDLKSLTNLTASDDRCDPRRQGMDDCRGRAQDIDDHRHSATQGHRIDQLRQQMDMDFDEMLLLVEIRRARWRKPPDEVEESKL